MIRKYAKLKVAVLISGTGTTLRNLLEKQAAGRLQAEIVQVISSNPHATGLNFAHDAGVPCQIIQRPRFHSTQAFSHAVFSAVETSNADLVALGGFLKRLLIPPEFENRVINIHPSLIPAFCGKGFYGLKVHDAVIKSGCQISGCTVHFVDDEYDHGPIIAQRQVPVLTNDTPQSLAARVFQVECELYPDVINQLAEKKTKVNDKQSP